MEQALAKGERNHPKLPRYQAALYPDEFVHGRPHGPNRQGTQPAEAGEKA